VWPPQTGRHESGGFPRFPQSGRSCNLCQGFSLGREVSSKVFTRLVLARTPALPRGEEVIQFSSIGVPRDRREETRPLSSPQLWLRSRFWASLYAQLEGKSPETTDLNRFRGNRFPLPRIRSDRLPAPVQMLFECYRQCSSQYGIVGAMRFGKVWPRTNFWAEAMQEGGESDEGSDCSARSTRTADCRIAFAGL